MHWSRSILIISVCLILYSAVYVCAQPRYTVTDLGAFQPTDIAGPYAVGSENGLPVRLNLDTDEKLFLGHFGHGGVANAVLPTGEAVGTTKLPSPNAPGGLWDAATF
jgi:hypothetical protein